MSHYRLVRFPAGKESEAKVCAYLDRFAAHPVAILIRSNLLRAGLGACSGRPYEGEYLGLEGPGAALAGLAVRYWTGAVMVLWAEDRLGWLEEAVSAFLLVAPVRRIEAPPACVDALQPVLGRALPQRTQKTCMWLDLASAPGLPIVPADMVDAPCG